MAIFRVRKFGTTPLALKMDTMIPMQNLICVPGRFLYGIGSDAIHIGANTLYVAIYV